MWYRVKDAVDPEIIDKVESTAGEMDGVLAIYDVQSRWVGHQLRADLHIEVKPQMQVAEGHEIAERVRHALFHALPGLTKIEVHVDPAAEDPSEFHQITRHHHELT